MKTAGMSLGKGTVRDGEVKVQTHLHRLPTAKKFKSWPVTVAKTKGARVRNVEE
jgi:hypothetical protein